MKPVFLTLKGSNGFRAININQIVTYYTTGDTETAIVFTSGDKHLASHSFEDLQDMIENVLENAKG